ncbi:hypothetical protein [Streptomyces noursei]|uniref:hypothetical protein n=1 Tax=Streptomyces noursei TaxID=1971 RepID=UPI001F037C4C|nr:hypothetical protein [Streptomyces noursei]
MCYEIRHYQSRPGRRQEWVRYVEEVDIPFQTSKGMAVTASFTDEQDDDGYVRNGAVLVTQTVAQGSPDTGIGRRPAASTTPAGGTWISMKGGRLDYDTAFTRR